MPAIARGVQRRRRLGQVFAHDAGVTNAAVGESQLVMCESDGP